MVSARFTFDPATNELTYGITTDGFAPDEILAATIHRVTTGDSSPAIYVLSNHGFKSIAGTERLSDPDREKLMSGALYLRIATRSKSTNNMRVSLKPTAQK